MYLREVLCQWVSLREKYERLWTAEWEKSASTCVKKVEGRSVKDQEPVAKVQEKCQAPTKQVSNSVKEVKQVGLQEKCRAPLEDRELVAQVQEKCQATTAEKINSIEVVIQAQEILRASLPKKTEEKILVRAQTLVARNRQATLQTKDENAQKKLLGRAQKVYAKYAASLPKQTSEPGKERDRHDHVRETAREVVAVLRYLRRVAEVDELRLLENEQELIAQFRDICLGGIPNKAETRPANDLGSLTSPHDISWTTFANTADNRPVKKQTFEVQIQDMCRTEESRPETERMLELKAENSCSKPVSVKDMCIPVNMKDLFTHFPQENCRVKLPKKEEVKQAEVSHEKCQVSLQKKEEDRLAQLVQENCRVPKYEDSRVIHRKRPAPQEQICVETPKKKRRGWRKSSRSANESQVNCQATIPTNDDNRVVNRKRPAPHDKHSVETPKKICRVPLPRNEESRVVNSTRSALREKQCCVETPKKKFQFTKIVWDL